MKNDSIKHQTITEIQKVLRSHKKFYVSSDFPFTQTVLFYITYRGKVMNEYLRSLGYTLVKAREVDIANMGKRKIKGDRNIWLTFDNYVNYRIKK